MSGKYRVEHLEDNTYQVIESIYDDKALWESTLCECTDSIMYQGSLADCEAWIMLTEGGYL